MPLMCTRIYGLLIFLVWRALLDVTCRVVQSSSKIMVRRLLQSSAAENISCKGAPDVYACSHDVIVPLSL